MPGEILREELRGIELARVNLDGTHQRMKCPAADGRQLRHEINRDGAVEIRLLHRNRAACERRLIPKTCDRAEHVVERHERIAQGETAKRDGDELERKPAMRSQRWRRVHRRLRTIATTMKAR